MMPTFGPVMPPRVVALAIVPTRSLLVFHHISDVSMSVCVL
jgi:hypothetical protein